MNIPKRYSIKLNKIRHLKEDIAAIYKLVLCQEKVQVKRGLFANLMKSYPAVFYNYVFQVIQFA